MNVRTAVLCAALAVIAIAAPSGARADEPTAGFRGDMLSQINAVERQILDLEGAVPQSKFTWRPAEGVRSISEVYSHIAFGNYIILKLAGYEPPTDAHFVPDLKKWDGQTTDKEKIAAMLRQSFDHVGLVNGTTWQYRLCALDVAGNVADAGNVRNRSSAELHNQTAHRP